MKARSHQKRNYADQSPKNLCSTASVFSRFSYPLVKSKRSFTTVKVDYLGETDLHRAMYKDVKPGQTLKEIAILQKHVDPADLQAMSCTISNKGNLPVDLIYPYLTELEKSTISATLLAPMLRYSLQSVRPLSELVNFAEVVETYHLKSGTKLYNNVKMACEVTNETRQIFKFCPTHPQNNLLTRQENRELFSKIKSLRMEGVILSQSMSSLLHDQQSIQSTSLPFYVENCSAKFAGKLSDKVGKLYFNAHNNLITQNGVGNCYEFAHVAFVKAVGRYLPADMISILRGDHVCLEIGDEKATAVSADVWAGNVAPYDQKQLNTYRRHNHLSYLTGEIERYNIITSYNKNYHAIDNLCSYRPAPRNPPVKSVFPMGIFGISLSKPKTTQAEQSSHNVSFRT